MRNLILTILSIILILTSCSKDNCCDDTSGNIYWQGYSYSTVQIGDQLWFAENCRYLPNVFPSEANSFTEPYCYVYDYEGVDVYSAMLQENYTTYGVLYNWTAVMTEDICPTGWHIPTDEDWYQLTDYLGGEEVAGGKMKESGYDHWSLANIEGTNSSGFTGLPAGYMGESLFGEGFNGESNVAVWWSSSPTASNTSAWKRNVYSDSKELIRKDHPGNCGFSVRCIRD